MSNTTNNTPTANLTAEMIDDTWTVVDTDGGRWFPDDEDAEQIATSDDPAAEAVRICDADPMSGQWRN